MRTSHLLLTTVMIVTLGTSAGLAQSAQMNFFITSAGPGNGADLGGLLGADRHCQSLAAAAGAGDRTWHAYLSAAASGGQEAVNARDRIGSGPWYNFNGVMVAENLDQLHGDNNLTKETIVTEKGRHGERSRRRSEHARYPHGLEPRRYRGRG